MIAIPFWKKLLSYFWEFKIEEIDSIYSEKLVVTFHQNNFKLTTKNAIYSFGNLYTSFKNVFNYIDIQNQKTKSVLILGLGLGSVIQLLNQHKHIKKITAVDIDETIIYLCKKYLNTNIHIDYINSDAFDYMENNSEVFDLVIVDLFIDDITPLDFQNIEFFNLTKKALAINGILLFSKLENSKQSIKENNQFAQVFSKIFNTAYTYKTDGNKIFIYKNI